MRECGDCNLCCLLLPIPEINSKHSQLCSECDKGCKIYENRPTMCKNFNCNWLVDESISEELRPDKCHIIFETINNDTVLALVDFNYLNSWKSSFIKKYISKLNNNNISVVISSYTNEPKRYFISDGKTKQEIINGLIKELNK